MKESDIQKQIMETLEQCGIFYIRLNSGEVRVHGGYLRLCPPGTGDIIVFPPMSTPVWLEIKELKGEQRKTQIAFQAKTADYGHDYYIVRSLDDIKPFINEWR